MLHKYSAKDLRQCIGERKVVFIGDSQVRQIFWTVATKLDRQNAEDESKKADKHSDQLIKGSDNLQLEFIWDPYLNSTKLISELTMAPLDFTNPGNGNSSAILVVGGGLWFAKNLEDSSLQQFTESIENILHTMGGHEQSGTQSRYFPEKLSQTDPTRILTLLVPVQKPLYQSLDSAHAKTLTADRVGPLHQKLLQISSQQSIPVLWAYDAMTNHSAAYQSDGLHLTENVVTAIADLILNVKCNSVLTAIDGYPMDKTCCSKYPPLKKVQNVLIYATWLFPTVIWLFPWIVTTTLVLSIKSSVKNDESSKRLDKMVVPTFRLSERMPPPRVSKGMAVLLLAACYCWLADRTHVYNKAQKQFSNGDFGTLCLLTSLTGILSLRRSKGPTRQRSDGSDTATEDLFLSRDQTDEWKGWMQVIILIYHYTGASKVLWIYKMIRLLVAAYLFLTGYGHTVFFYSKADFTLKRVIGVLIRLNLLSCVLPYAMQTDYLFYYFAPLVSFWYIVVYATMAIGRSWNSNLPFLMLKILISATVVSNLISSRPGFFESAFLILNNFCNIRWDAHDWQFRLELDKYIVFVGMLVAACTVTNKGKNAVPCNNLEELVRPISSTKRPPPLRHSILHMLNNCLKDRRLVYLTTTFGGCLYYALFAYPAIDKKTHNSIFPVASVGPILAFIAVRNSFAWTRRFHSSIFAWVGRHSLETFVLQFHIWLAADTKGILSTGLFDRNQERGKWLDFSLLTVLFLWVCWHTADAMQVLTAYVVEPRQGQQSSLGLLVTKADRLSEERTPRKEPNTVRGVAARYIAVRIWSVVRMPKNVIAESLGARLVVILGVLWCLNMLK